MESFFSFCQFDDASSVGFQVIVNRVASAEPPEDKKQPVPKRRAVVVVIVPDEDGFDVVHLFHRSKKAGTDIGRRDQLAFRPPCFAVKIIL